MDRSIAKLKRVTDEIVDAFNAGEDPSVDFIMMLSLYATTLSSLAKELQTERYLPRIELVQ